jgi:hypothetical protein
MSVRCKFRCLSITHNATPNLTGTEVRLVPVCPKSSSYPNGCEENKSFWDATPSGELKVSFAQDAEVPFLLGRSYYIDLEQTDEGDDLWKLWEVNQHSSDICIRLGLGWSHDRPMMSAEFETCINNQNAWAPFVGHVDTKWTVTFTEAPFTGEEEPSVG